MKIFNIYLFIFILYKMKLLKSVTNLFSLKHILVLVGLLGTGIGAFGGMPQPPKLLVKLSSKYKLFQWLLVYVLIWQGAGGYNELLSLYGTFILFLLYTLVEKLAENKVVYKFLGIVYDEEVKE